MIAKSKLLRSLRGEMRATSRQLAGELAGRPVQKLEPAPVRQMVRPPIPTGPAEPWEASQADECRPAALLEHIAAATNAQQLEHLCRAIGRGAEEGDISGEDFSRLVAAWQERHAELLAGKASR